MFPPGGVSIFSDGDLEALIPLLPSFTQSADALPDRAGLYFASTRFLVKDDRCVLSQGDSVAEAHPDEALTVFMTASGRSA